jgi:type IV pilus assembly protein PilF
MSQAVKVLLSVLLTSLLGACAAPEKPVETKSAKSSQINVELGVTYMKEGKYNTAMDRLQKAINQNPTNPQAYSSMALLNMRLLQLDEAEKNFNKAIKLSPNDSAIRNNFGAYLCQQKRFDEAEEQFLTATKNPLYRSPEHALMNAGKCTQDKVKAEKYFRASLRNNPIFPGALIEMAKLSFENKQYLSARAYLQRFHAVNEPTAISLWTSIQVENHLGDNNTMNSHALLLKKKFPDSEETRQYLQWVNNER